jgi:hypothetical protein
MQLPSAADLVAAFVKDLSNVLNLSIGEAKPTRTIIFTSSTTAIQNWRADADYVIVAITASSTSVQVLSLDQTPTTILSAVDKVNSGAGLILATNFVGTIYGLRFPLPNGSRLYWAPAASGEFCNVILQYA